MRALLIAAFALMLSGATPAAAQTPPADTILINGKIVTVDDRFTIADYFDLDSVGARMLDHVG